MLTDRVRISRRGWFLVIAVIIALLPFVIQGSYWRTNLIVCAINIMLAIGLDFILGYAGQLNLGHSAFYGIGAYASTLLAMKLGVPFWVAFVFGMVLSGAAGMALSIFAVRLRGHYLAIASLGFAVIVHQVLLNWISLTQGPLGIYAIKPPPDIALPGLPVISFGNTANMFYLVASFAFLFYLLLDQLVRSPIGETLKAIREDEISASAFGINCTAWKVFAFGIGSAVAGAAGAFYASFVGTLVPDAFIITESFTILAMVIVGGMGTLIGPVWGAILLTILPELLRGFGDLRLILYGAALTLVVLFMPGGIAQAAQMFRVRLARLATAADAGMQAARRVIGAAADAGKPAARLVAVAAADAGLRAARRVAEAAADARPRAARRVDGATADAGKPAGRLVEEAAADGRRVRGARCQETDT